MSAPTSQAIRPLAEELAQWIAGVRYRDVPDAARAIAENDLLDVAGLCVAARNTDYIRALIGGWDAEGGCTAFGHVRGFDSAGAALVNGAATHGEDFDDTLEGSPIRVGAIAVPAVLAACERFGCSGEQAMLGIAVGMEVICRLNQVVPGGIHKAGFHPVGTLTTFGAAAGVGKALGLGARELALALGIAGSMSSGILEYLTEGAWTKRMHPGWAAQSGLRAALFAKHGFVGPRTVFDGKHSFFHEFAPSAEPKLENLMRDIGSVWHLQKIAFKPYAAGTMIHPYIDCMIRLAATGIGADDIVDIVCETGEGLVPRLWEPLADKHRPPSGYAAKFSMPYCMAVGFFDRAAGLEQFTDARARDPEVLALAAKIRYVIDPDNEYPRNYSGHVRVSTKDGRTIELRQPHFRGGSREPLRREELIRKFRQNVAYGGWDEPRADALRDFCLNLASRKDLAQMASFRG
ncbi:MAG: MmgE/PrpD family protein [Betaproteobacteria bacterium]|nr:MmgE/PrpD family protein [Betaproteobacteria bacterium]